MNVLKAAIIDLAQSLGCSYKTASDLVYSKLSKAARGEMAPNHEYLRRTGVPGSYRYWYKLSNGHVVSSDSPSGPPHVDHSKTYDEAVEEKTKAGNLKQQIREQDQKLEKEWMDKFNTQPITFLISRDQPNLNQKIINKIDRHYNLTDPKKKPDQSKIAHGYGVGAAPTLGVTMGTIKDLSNQFSKELFKKFNADVENLAIQYDCTLINSSDTAGSWLDTDIKKVVFEPSKRLSLMSDNPHLVRGLAAEIGKEYNQSAVYIADYTKEGNGYEYSLRFSSLNDANEVIKNQLDYDFIGSSLDVKSKTIYFGDEKGDKADNFAKLLRDLKNKGISHEPKARRAKIEFIHAEEYDKCIQRASAMVERTDRPDNERQKVAKSNSFNSDQSRKPEERLIDQIEYLSGIIEKIKLVH